MKVPEKNTDTFIQTVKRSIITTTVIAIILFLLKVFPSHGQSNFAVFGTIWCVIFCIYFGGHWLELFFVNKITFILPRNIFILYSVKIIYWFLCSIPLFVLATLVNNFLSHGTRHIGKWWQFGFLYIGIQLAMYTIMQIRFKKSFYNALQPPIYPGENISIATGHEFSVIGFPEEILQQLN